MPNTDPNWVSTGFNDWGYYRPPTTPPRVKVNQANVVGLPDYEALMNKVILGQQASNASRIPNDPALEEASSASIMPLLMPGTMFSDVNRMAAERGGAAGIPGSANEFGVGLRMNDEERLRRIALGQNLLSQATARNPGANVLNPLELALNPQQQTTAATTNAQLSQQQNQLDLQRELAYLQGNVSLWNTFMNRPSTSYAQSAATPQYSYTAPGDYYDGTAGWYDGTAGW